MISIFCVEFQMVTPTLMSTLMIYGIHIEAYNKTLKIGFIWGGCNCWKHITINYETFISQGIFKECPHWTELRIAYWGLLTQSANLIVIVSGEFRTKPPLHPILDNCQLNPLKQNFSETLSKTQIFFSKKYLKMIAAKYRPFRWKIRYDLFNVGCSKQTTLAEHSYCPTGIKHCTRYLGRPDRLHPRLS